MCEQPDLFPESVPSRFEVDTVTGPACWASALINGDDSSFSLDDDGGEAELAALEAWLAPLTAEGWRVVGIVEDSERFSWSFALHGGTAQGGDVVDFEILREVK